MTKPTPPANLTPPAAPPRSHLRAGMWALGFIGLLAGIYAVQIAVVAQRYSEPAETQNLGHGITLEIWEERTWLDDIPIVGLLHLTRGGECLLVLTQNGQDLYRENFYPVGTAPLTGPARLYQINGQMVLRIEDASNRIVFLGLPPPPDLPMLPSVEPGQAPGVPYRVPHLALPR